MSKRDQFNVRLTDEERAKLSRLAASQRLSEGAVLRWLLAEAADDVFMVRMEVRVHPDMPERLRKEFRDRGWLYEPDRLIAAFLESWLAHEIETPKGYVKPQRIHNNVNSTTNVNVHKPTE